MKLDLKKFDDVCRKFSKENDVSIMDLLKIQFIRCMLSNEFLCEQKLQKKFIDYLETLEEHQKKALALSFVFNSYIIQSIDEDLFK